MGVEQGLVSWLFKMKHDSIITIQLQGALFELVNKFLKRLNSRFCNRAGQYAVGGTFRRKADDQQGAAAFLVHKLPADSQPFSDGEKLVVADVVDIETWLPHVFTLYAVCVRGTLCHTQRRATVLTMFSSDIGWLETGAPDGQIK